MRPIMLLSRRDLFVAAAAVVARPRRVPAQTPLAPGQHRLDFEADRDGLLFVPSGANAGAPRPLMVLLHGAGGSAARMAGWFPIADEANVIVVAPDSRDRRTWDAALGEWGPDSEFVARAVGRAIDRCPVDSRRMCVGGFSDGASYALTLGIGAGDVFSHIAAFSPGFMQPRDRRGKPRIFISHGTGDQVLPIDATSRRFVPALKKLTYDVTYREYAGRHAVPEPIVRDAFRWFLD
jgi:phospholipase/carboxylesterase